MATIFIYQLMPVSFSRMKYFRFSIVILFKAHLLFGNNRFKETIVAFDGAFFDGIGYNDECECLQ